MAEMNVPSGPKYRLKKINDIWFLENSHTRTTKRVPFLSRKVHIMLEDNIIFADDNQYAIRVTEDGKDKIEKVTDLDYITSDETNVNRMTEDDYVRIEKVTDLEQGEPNVNRAAAEGSTRTDTVPNLEELASDEVDDIVTSTQGGSARSQQPVTSRQAATYDGPYVTTRISDYVPFRVVLENTSLAKLCGLSGNMELRVEKSAISFYETNSQSLGYRFQYNWIRRYGNIGRNVFTIEVGRRCPNGEGEIRVNAAGDAAKITLFSKTNMR